MKGGFLILVVVLVGYFSIAGAIFYHLYTYSLSRRPHFIPLAFLTLSITLAAFALVSFWHIRWAEIFSTFLYSYQHF